jgi:hypothetical protein
MARLLFEPKKAATWSGKAAGHEVWKDFTACAIIVHAILIPGDKEQIAYEM